MKNSFPSVNQYAIIRLFSFAVVGIVMLSGCARKITETGMASYYGEGDGFKGRKTASGEVFNPKKLTAAHKTLPFGTVVKVINVSNGQQVKVRINDRGPFVAGRVIDLSAQAARKIDMKKSGVVQVKLKYKKKKK
jgi:rare lipoprotein A